MEFSVPLWLQLWIVLLDELNVAFSSKVCLLLLWWPLLMLSRQDCKWLPGLARQHTAGSSTVSGRFSGKKGLRRSGKGLQVDAGGEGSLPEWLSGFCVLSLPQPSRRKVYPTLSVFSSSSVPVLSSVWCHSGHLWTSAAVVLHWFWRPVSASASPYKYGTQPKPVLVLFTEPLCWDATKSFKSSAWRAMGFKSSHVRVRPYQRDSVYSIQQLFGDILRKHRIKMLCE